MRRHLQAHLGEQAVAAEVGALVRELAVVLQRVVAVAGPEGAVGHVQEVGGGIAAGETAQPAVADRESLLDDPCLGGRGLVPEDVLVARLPRLCACAEGVRVADGQSCAGGAGQAKEVPTGRFEGHDGYPPIGRRRQSS
jgi:hypothetical protein